MQDNDIVLLQNDSPMAIEIWNSETKKLIKRYKFEKEVDKSISYTGYAYLDCIACDMIGDDVWAIAEGVQTNLIKLNITTGKLTFIAKNADNYNAIKAIKKEEDGRGTIWISQFMQPMWGGHVRCYDTDGNLLNKFVVRVDDTDFDVHNLKYSNGKYSSFCVCNAYYVYELNKNSDDQDCFRNLEFDLENKTYEFKKIPYTDFLSKEFLSQFDYFQDKFQCGTYFCGNDYLKLHIYMDMPDYMRKRVFFLYHYNQSKSSYEFVKAFDDKLEINRAVDYVNGIDKDNYTIIGRDISNIDNYSDYNWFIDIYKNNVLMNRYKFFGLRGYQIPKDNRKTQWFGCKQINDSNSSIAYIYDWENNRLYTTDKDGNKVDISESVKVSLE